MKLRGNILPFVLVEGLLLLALVVPIVHARSFSERLRYTADSPLLPASAPDEGQYILLRSLVMVLALQACFALRDLYRWSVITRPQLAIMRLVEGVATALLGLPLLHYLFGVADTAFELNGRLRRLQVHPMLLLAAIGACFLLAYGLRMRWPRWLRRARLGDRLLIAGSSPTVDVIEEELRRRKDPGLQLLGHLEDRDPPPPHRRHLGRCDDVARVVSEHGVQLLVVDPGARIPSEALLAVRLDGVTVQDAPNFYERLTGRLSVENLCGLSRGLGGASEPGTTYPLLQRVLDLVVASLGLLLALPLCLLVAAAIKLESRGPIFYRQERVGRGGRNFMLTKFRSMRADAEAASGPVWASGDDARITRVGRWLRRLRIDEIPQLTSVILGDMSLVGPRPERPFFVEELQRRIPNYALRHAVKPGVTGWAQINHSYGSSVDDAFIKLQYDLWYIRERGLALDAAILLRTVKVVVLQQGAV
ncbi:MAG: sugar transferase [Planctomycetota bacterium]